MLASALFAVSDLSAGAHSAFYLLGGLDAKVLSNQDANDYFNLPAGQIAPAASPSAVIRLGAQLHRLLALEIGLDLGPSRQYEAQYHNFGVNTRRVSTRWSKTTLSIMPALTWSSPERVQLLGLRIGQSRLAGHTDDWAYGVDGAYDSEAETLDAGILFRSTWIFVSRFSMGLELGYDWTQFRDIKNKDGSGSYGSVHSPERNVSSLGHAGAASVLDYSGGHVAVVFGLWSNAPYTEGGPGQDGAE